MMSKKILFISHQASRTGAPIVLLHLIRWMKSHSDFSIAILLMESGELDKEFHELADTYIWQLRLATSGWKNRWQRFVRKKQVHQKRIINELKKINPDLIYANTVVAAPLGVALKEQLNCLLLCHVHELSMVINGFIGNDKFTNLSKSIDIFFAASEAVVLNLQKSHHIAPQAITRVYEFVPALAVEDYTATRRNIKEQLGLSKDAFIVVGSGSIDWRKAPDLFVQVAQHVRKVHSYKIDFIWVGGSLNSIEGQQVQYDVIHAGIADCVHFIGAQSNPFDYLSIADIFLLTSREDPYPLVCLESAALGKPIICFADAGGMPEFVEQDCGYIIPYLRVDLMASSIQNLYNSDTLRKMLGQNAARKMRERHTVDIAGNQIQSLLQSFLN